MNKIITILSTVSLISTTAIPVSNLVAKEIFNKNNYIEKTNLNKFDNSKVSLHNINFSEGWEDNIYKTIGEYLLEINQADLGNLFINVNKYKMFFTIYGDDFSKPKIGEYNKYLLVISALEDNPYYVGSTNIEIKLWNDNSQINIEEEYQDFINSQYFKENFKLDLRDSKDNVNISFLKAFIKFVNLDQTKKLLNAEILWDAWLNKEFTITNEEIKSNDFLVQYNFKITTIQSEISSILQPGVTLELQNIKGIKHDKISFQDFKPNINEILQNKSMKLNNYNSTEIINQNIRIIDSYMNQHSNGTIYESIGDFLTKYRNEYDIKGVQTKGLYFEVIYKFTPKEDSQIFKNSSILEVTFSSEDVYKNESYVINSNKIGVSGWSNWSSRFNFNSSTLNTSIDFGRIKGINNFDDLIKNFTKIRMYVDGYIQGSGNGSDKKEYGNEFNPNDGVIQNSKGAKYLDISLQNLKNNNSSGNKKQLDWEPKLDHKQGATSIQGRLENKIYYSNAAKKIYFENTLFFSTYRAGIPKAYADGWFIIRKIDILV
ncbi:hypothetical protein SSYRP_v1c02780 [Spiroplasma syrphidicola EA-1]|uniref:Uncharacterized protein n=1 Tax=Spiroplasma syrphidicola EA-1 TaxID=1276229 RepID=R4UD83_9MOLU|nr:hypothetical protein [Spiroplasma syrphidicola]AGM25874.1 hypothetical protein SSYRP_v1c02780 [Spiroplasma syrphidicola EA-1]